MFLQISVGDNFYTGVTTTGIVYAWGRNAEGQMGDNTTVSKLTPVAVCGL